MFFRIATFLCLLGAFAQIGVDFGLVYVMLYGNYVMFLAMVFLQVMHRGSPMVVDGVLIVYHQGFPVYGSLVFLGRMWYVSGVVHNRLMHALNGNINGLGRLRLVAFPFVVLFAVFFMVDLLTGFQFGFMGYFRIISTTSQGRFRRFWEGCGRILRKYTILAPLLVLVVLVSPVVLVLFVIYDIIAVIVITYWPDRNVISDDPNFERRVRVGKYAYDNAAGETVPAVIVENGPDNKPYAGKSPRFVRRPASPISNSGGATVVVSQPAIVEASASGEFSMTGPAIAHRKLSSGSTETIKQGDQGYSPWDNERREHERD